MIELQLNGNTLPATLSAGVEYRVDVVLNGAIVVPSSWSVSTGGSQVAHGFGSFIVFTPATPTAHTISAKAAGEFGLVQEVAQTVNVAAFAGQAEAGVKWEKLVFAAGENLKAKIVAKDSRGTVPSRIIWVLYRNGHGVFAGEGATFRYTGSSVGLYRLRGIAYCFDGSQLAFDSTVFVGNSVNVRHSLPVPQYDGTAVYLGAVFTQNIVSGAGVATELPYQLASSTEDIFLLPGTTHWTFDLDPTTTPVDDEVVVRTQKGNWCLNGVAGGLMGENIGYDYGYMPTYIPAPVDCRIRLTADFFKVHGVTYASFNTRLRIKCWRVLPSGIFRYERCACGSASHPGGQGRRTRRFAVMFTNLDLQTDVSSGLNRLGTGSAVVPYTTVNATSVPLMTLSTSGTPNPVPGFSGLFFTDSNLYAHYEADGQQDIAVKAISAIENVRPCCITTLSFNNSKPVIHNLVKRVYGKAVLFLTDGAIFAGSVATIQLNPISGAVSRQITITEDHFVDDDATIVKVGEVDIDITADSFAVTGLAVEVSVDDSAAVVSPVPSPVPTPVVGPEHIYSPTYSRTVVFDGACYVNPVYTPTLDDNAVTVTAIGGCHDPVCGLAADYCYTSNDAPTEKVIVPQPFGFPAPFIAFGSNPARCFNSPASMAVAYGSYTAMSSFNGTDAVDIWTYSGSDLCGYSYLYSSCRPANGYGASIIVVYPVSGSPHATVEYSGRCYSFSGSSVNYGTRPVVGVSSVSPVADCHDPVCNQFNATGSVVVYTDRQTGLDVPVRFDHLDFGTAYYGAIPQSIDNWSSGLTEGRITVGFKLNIDALVYTSTGTGSMMFEVSLPGSRKQFVRDRSGLYSIYTLGIGSSRQIIELLPGDKIYLRITDAYGRLPFNFRYRRVAVRWHPLPFLPRLYDTTVVAYSGSSSIKALGFCAYTAQGNYSFYGTLPFNGSMTGPVNPDSLVTVTGQDGQEYNVLGVRAVGDINFFPLGLPWYSGQSLNGPFTFKFYAARDVFGAHGEMDVWFDTNGTFPTYLRAGSYDALALTGTYYRKDSEFTDTTRNSYSVVSQLEAEAATWPFVYLGSILVSRCNALAVYSAGKYYQVPSYISNVSPYQQQPYYDAGLAYTITDAGPVAAVVAQTSPHSLDWVFTGYPDPVNWVVEESDTGVGNWYYYDLVAGNLRHWKHGVGGYDYRVIGVDSNNLPVTEYSNVVVYT